jgi:nucleoid-associated protein YgaU
VVSVEPTGEAVIAGRAAPNARVELRDAGKTVAEATADASGQFVFTPPALAPGDHSLSLAAGDSKAAAETSNVVAVSVPQPEEKAAAVASPAPKAAPAPAPSAQAMRTIAKPPASRGARVAIQTVEADAAGGLIAKGSADPNATVRLYLNQAPVADARTQSDGRWSLTIKSGMTPGDYLMRADEITGGSTVVASAGTPFAYPEAPAPASASPSAPASASTESLAAASLAAASAGGAPSPADPVIDSVQTKRVVSGHTLWALSQNYYRDPTRYPVIVEANKWEIHNPNLIYPGEVFVVPKFEPKP